MNPDAFGAQALYCFLLSSMLTPTRPPARTIVAPSAILPADICHLSAAKLQQLVRKLSLAENLTSRTHLVSSLLSRITA